MTGPLEGVDGPRPMPAELRRRLEEQLLSGVPLPAETRTRLTRRLADSTAAAMEGIDGPRAMPAGLRTRIELGLNPNVTVLPRRHRYRSWPAAVAVAAVILLLSSLSVVVDDPSRDQVAVSGEAESSEGVSGDSDGLVRSGTPNQAAVGKSSGDGTSVGAGGTAGAGAGGLASPRQSNRGEYPRGEAPPYTSNRYTAPGEGQPLDSSADFATGGSGEPPPPPPPFRIALRAGDGTAEAGFKAYVELVNRNGGARGRLFEVVRATSDADVVVNLSGVPFAGVPAKPALDDFLAPESSLKDAVFSFAGVVERQGHLIADAVYPKAASGSAVVYRTADGPLGTSVPQAIESVLRSRGVSTTSVVVQPGQTITALPADAVFLSLSAPEAARVTAAYRTRPAKGFHGIGTVADAGAGLPDGVRVLSPYDLPTNNETQAVTSHAKRPLSAALVHGWVAAKTLAMAVWQDDPRTPAQLRSALHSMASFNNGFAPSREVRPGTNSLRPEGILLEVRGGAFTRLTDFLTDPH